MAKKSTSIVLAVLLVLVALHCAMAATHWGEFTKSDCQRPGFRIWYSRLWDATGDWNAACKSTPATVNGYAFPAGADQCVDKGIGGLWGEFYVPANTCT